QISLFQIMTSSTTAGFNTVSIGGLHSASLTLILFAMIIGASPSGTGGGIKTTTFTALLAVTISMLKGQTYISFFKNRVPLVRLFTAVSSVTIYLFVLTLGLFALTLTDQQDFLKLVFESASALGTVGLSMGITGDLSNLGKLILTLLMFLGRVGPLTIGLAILYNPLEHDRIKDADLAV
ncbi:MAG TPA: potassium transporter TrkG, partial [Leptospiraceae bacterium]|nr:potassium transporter TrkG [Leptospiraceae bacterium]